MKHRAVLVVIACLLPMFTDARAIDQELLAARVLDESGIARTIATFPRQLEAQFRAVPAAAGDPERARVVVAKILEGWDEARTLAMVRDYVLEHATGEELEAILRWLESDAGRRVAATEQALALEGTTEAGQARMLGILSDLRGVPPDAARMDVIERLEVASAALDTLLGMMGIMVDAALRGINALVSPHERLGAAELESASGAARARLSEVAGPLLREQYLLAARYAYRDLTIDELERYVEFLSSRPGRVYTGIARGVARAYAAVIDEAIGRLEETEGGN